ncbi:MAG: hypothetical protein QXR60_02330 [Candidatus Nanoarchaeia archaeon]
MKLVRLVSLFLVFSLTACASTMKKPTTSPPTTQKVVKEIICQYASSAAASSENPAGSLAVYAVGKPDAPTGGECGKWSGYGFSWTPSNWNVKANLLLVYGKPLYITNVTIIGDYDMCWSSVKLINNSTGEEKKILNSISKECVLKIHLDEPFKADRILLESCGWSWSATDAVEICGFTN